MNPESFDSELKTYYMNIKKEIKQEHQQYIEKHPELRQILNDFLSSVLLEKPKDVYEYSKEFFSYFNIDKDKTKFNPLIISGPGGVGKSTVIKTLLQKYPKIFQQSISYTTRQPRPGEMHGQDYYFVSKQEFENELNKQQFIEYSEINDQYFGTHKGKLNAIIQQGFITILELDVEGAKQIYSTNKDWKFIYLMPQGTSTLESRMKDKGMKDQVEIEERLTKAIQDIENHKTVQFYTDIHNNNLEETVEQIVDFIRMNYSDLQI